VQSVKKVFHEFADLSISKQIQQRVPFIAMVFHKD